MRIIYMGTPDFSVGALESLIRAGHDICLVVTQPDKPKGRGKEVQFTPVKECALAHGIPVFQPVKIKEPEAVGELRKYQADVFVVAAFGQILSEEILQMPQYGCINIHASLLPKYRGSAPIQWAIINGEEETGVTIMQMDKGVDTGDMLYKRTIKLQGTETGESLFDDLAKLGAEAIVEALDLLEEGKLIPEKQDESQATKAKMLSKALGKIDWTQSAETIERLVRGLNSWPSAYSTLHGKTVKIWEAKPISKEALLQAYEGEEKMFHCLQQAASDLVAPGAIALVAKDAVFVKTGEGFLKITKLQLEGKKRMDVKDFLLGYKVTAIHDSFV